MFDFRVLRHRTVLVRLKDGTHFRGEYRTILSSWDESKPTLWVSDWSLEHLVPLDRVAELETS